MRKITSKKKYKHSFTLEDMTKKNLDPIAFPATVIAYPDEEAEGFFNQATLVDTQRLIKSGNFSIELVMPYGDIVGIIIKPKDDKSRKKDKGKK